MLFVKRADLLFQLLDHLLLLDDVQISIIDSSSISLDLGLMLLILKTNPKLVDTLLQRYPQQLYLCPLLFAYGRFLFHNLLQLAAFLSLFDQQLIELVFRKLILTLGGIPLLVLSNCLFHLFHFEVITFHYVLLFLNLSLEQVLLVGQRV